MNVKLLLAQLGLAGITGQKGYKKERVSPLAREREQFEKEVKNQFEKLREKGLSIPVFTL